MKTRFGFFKRLSYGAAFFLLAALFLSLVIVNNALLRNVRIDLTENRLYTLSDGIKNILAGIREPVTLHLFFSEKSAGGRSDLKNYHRRVSDILEQYRRHSDGALRVNYVDPEPFSEAEDRATQMGVKNVRLKGGESLYFGLAGTNALDDIEVIPFLQRDKEVFLEYEIGKMIYALTRLDKPVMGLLTTLDMYPPASEPTAEKWLITDQLEQLFEIRKVETDTEKIADGIDVLMVVHPANLGEKTLYAVDQFIMRGGKGLFFTDPYSNLQASSASPGAAADEALKSSSLNRLFSKWGFTVDENFIVADPARALRVSLSTGGQARHIAMLSLQPEDFNKNDPVAEGLQNVNFAMASYVKLSADSEVSLEPLIESSKSAGLIAVRRISPSAHPDNLRRGLRPADMKYPLAARISGPMKSAFDRPPEGVKSRGSHISETDGDANLAVIADTDLLTDNMWARVQNFFGTRILRPFAGNRDLTVNLVENLFGSSALISIRSRASYSRPFTRVLEIERAADQKYRETEENLQREYAEFQRRLRELQEQKTDENKALLTREQKREQREVRKKMVEVRKKLRNVRHRQVRDIEELGARLKIINIAAVPAVVIVGALFAASVRIRKRRRRRPL